MEFAVAGGTLNPSAPRPRNPSALCVQRSTGWSSTRAPWRDAWPLGEWRTCTLSQNVRIAGDHPELDLPSAQKKGGPRSGKDMAMQNHHTLTSPIGEHAPPTNECRRCHTRRDPAQATQAAQTTEATEATSASPPPLPQQKTEAQNE